ncbi:MAG: DUF4410 domain-containing protein [Candidatus Methylomirabilota bacterium]
MRATLLILTIVMLASACSTQQVQVQPAVNLKTIGSSVALDIQGKNVDPAVIDGLTRYLKAKLIIAGFDIDPNAPKGIQLRVDVSAFDPGNQGLRLTVGFGAGRGALLYTARYVDREGHVLAQMEGQEYFTGAEVDFNTRYGPATTLGGAETVQNVLIQEAANHIVELALGEKK